MCKVPNLISSTIHIYTQKPTWWFMPIILALRRQKQEDHEFLSQNKQTNKQKPKGGREEGRKFSKQKKQMKNLEGMVSVEMLPKRDKNEEDCFPLILY
jgi:hypothetical protein